MHSSNILMATSQLVTCASCHSQLVTSKHTTKPSDAGQVAVAHPRNSAQHGQRNYHK